MNDPTREQAIRALHDLFDKVFGCDKGSDEMYVDWCESHGLVSYGSGGEDYPMPEDWPGCLQFLSALGVTPREMIDVLHVNPRIFEEQEGEAPDGTDVGPHEFRPIRFWDAWHRLGRCAACFVPRCGHPTGLWTEARPLGDASQPVQPAALPMGHQGDGRKGYGGPEGRAAGRRTR